MNWVAEFLKDVPNGLLGNLTTAVKDAYFQSNVIVESQGLGTPERRNLIPWQRRAQVEHRVKSAALRFGEPVVVTTENTGYWNHVVLKVGRFRITQSTVASESASLHPAVYKQRYASEQTQLLLEFAKKDLQKSNEEEKYFYLVFLHRAAFNKDQPEFISIKFPQADLSCFHAGSVDLLAMFGNEKSSAATPVEEIVDETVPKLKPLNKVEGIGK